METCNRFQVLLVGKLRFAFIESVRGEVFPSYNLESYPPCYKENGNGKYILDGSSLFDFWSVGILPALLIAARYRHKRLVEVALPILKSIKKEAMKGLGKSTHRPNSTAFKIDSVPDPTSLAPPFVKLSIVTK